MIDKVGIAECDGVMARHGSERIVFSWKMDVEGLLVLWKM